IIRRTTSERFKREVCGGGVKVASLQDALALIELGLSIFPVKVTEDDQKIPLTPAGHLDSTLDPSIVEAWWDKHPNAEIGVHTGASGINVLDLDVKEGVDPYAELGFNETPNTYGYSTGSGGEHY